MSSHAYLGNRIVVVYMFGKTKLLRATPVVTPVVILVAIVVVLRCEGRAARRVAVVVLLVVLVGIPAVVD